MLDWLISALKLKIIIHWVVIYIVVNILEFIIMKVIFSWMFSSKEPDNEQPNQ